MQYQKDTQIGQLHESGKCTFYRINYGTNKILVNILKFLLALQHFLERDVTNLKMLERKIHIY